MTDDGSPRYHPACTPCVVGLPHQHVDDLPPMWPCVHCHNFQHVHCDSARQFCTCDCGLKETDDHQG